jgi:hypothetical protein
MNPPLVLACARARAASGALTGRQWHRSFGRTSASTLSMCRPQPVYEGLPQLLHVMRRHMWVLPSLSPFPESQLPAKGFIHGTTSLQRLPQTPETP